MEPIELSRWEPSPEDPRRKQYAGQRTAQEVFEELRHRLEGMGYLPDEYFLMNRDWENGREIPRGADIFCTTDYGGSEGIYLDVSLQWYENDRTVTRNFITGKTLGETGADLDRMFLISSAITKAFHGDRGTYARYLSCGEQPEPEAMIVHLDPAEQRTIIQALVEQRERQEQAMSQTEQLLRRMTGSITAYMEEVGQRPLRMSDYDKTVLAIQDGELTEFWARYPKALDQADSLLVETAGRPGAVGRRMTLSILSAATKISPSAYLTACKRAVDTGDGQRVQSLIEQAESCLSEPLPALTGVAILHAYTNGHRNMAKDLIAQCTSEQIAAAPPNLLRLVAERLDFQTAMELVDKGVQPVIVCTKGDLAEAEFLRSAYEKSTLPFVRIDYATGEGLDDIKHWINGRLCAFCGNSGVGKSTLLNALLPDVERQTAAISQKLGRGRHTTREVTIFEAFGGRIADTPGFASLEASRAGFIPKENLEHAFPEFGPYLGACQFTGCSHRSEKGCAVRAALAEGKLSQTRYDSYCAMYDEVKDVKEWQYPLSR